MKISALLLLFVISFSACAQGTFKNITEKNGKVGIGTNAPDELLTVKGKIHTQEVLVDLNGAVAPDYVFEKYFEGFSALQPTYEMMDLETLELFLKQNHHLPKIPSAETFQNKGMHLKEMNLLLLEKIEELTLYTLQQQKQIDGLITEMKVLKEKG